MILLRPATADDVGRPGLILQGWLDATPGIQNLHNLSETQDFPSHRHEPIEVTVAGDAPPGGLARNGDDAATLDVARDAGGHGVGHFLIRAVQNPGSCLAICCVQVNTRARRFYARHCLTETRRSDGADTAERLPDIRLEWSRA